jgi:hypothetical protein
MEVHTPSPSTVVVRIAADVIRNIFLTIGAQEPETGGILLGPVASNDITNFYFDSGAACSNVTYAPDYITLRRKMKQEWLPHGIDMKGFVHSHPGRFDTLSRGDFVYINKLFKSNPDMDLFVAPIVIPGEFRMQPLVVRRSSPHVAQLARVIVI